MSRFFTFSSYPREARFQKGVYKYNKHYEHTLAITIVRRKSFANAYNLCTSINVRLRYSTRYYITITIRHAMVHQYAPITIITMQEAERVLRTIIQWNPYMITSSMKSYNAPAVFPSRYFRPQKTFLVVKTGKFRKFRCNAVKSKA